MAFSLLSSGKYKQSLGQAKSGDDWMTTTKGKMGDNNNKKG
jgi:hypothetical protein